MECKQCYRSVTEGRQVLQCYRGQASVTVLQSPGQGTDGGMCDGTYVRELVHVNVTRDEFWETSRMPPVLCHNFMRKGIPVERVASLTPWLTKRA